MEICIHSVEPGLVCLSCKGQIQQLPTRAAQDSLLGLIGNAGWAGKVLLNLSEAEYIDSSGLAWLIAWYREAEQAGGTLALCEVPPRIADVFRLCGLDRVFAIWPEESAARAALLGSSRRPVENPPSTFPGAGPA
jgi:anti-sigma B factor antagonist